MVSCSTWVILPIDSCWPRATLRSRLLNTRTTMAMKGTTDSVISVNCQFSQSSQTSRPMMDNESLISEVSALVAAPATPVTS